MIGLQLIGVAIAVIGIYMSYLHFKKKDFNRFEFFTWVVIWAGFLIVTVSPTTFDFVMDAFSFDSMLDVVIVTSIIVVYILCFRNYVVGRRIEKKLDQLVRSDALSNLNPNDD